MSSRTSFWRSGRWRAVIQPDHRIAAAEGLAAGTGLLTGSVARSANTVHEGCPQCAAHAEVVVIDLVDQAVTLRCPVCGHRWVKDETATRIKT